VPSRPTPGQGQGGKVQISKSKENSTFAKAAADKTARQVRPHPGLLLRLRWRYWARQAEEKGKDSAAADADDGFSGFSPGG